MLRKEAPPFPPYPISIFHSTYVPNDIMTLMLKYTRPQPLGEVALRNCLSPSGLAPCNISFSLQKGGATMSGSSPLLSRNSTAKANLLTRVQKHFFKRIYFFWERVRGNKQGAGRERGGEKESQVGSALSGQSLMRDLNSPTVRS